MTLVVFGCYVKSEWLATSSQLGWSRGGKLSVFAIIITLCIVVFVVLIAVFVGRSHQHDRLPYEKKRFFFSLTERALYDALKLSVGDQYLIFTKANAADVLRVKNGLPQRFYKKIKRCHVDYVLCEPDNLTVSAVVLLEHNINQHKPSIEQDLLLRQALDVAGLPYTYFKIQKSYVTSEVTKSLEACLKQSAKVMSAQKQAAALLAYETPVDEPEVVEVDLQPIEGNQRTQEKSCPKCLSTMLLKKAEKGRRAGQYFYMCSQYPVCKRAEPVEVSESEKRFQDSATLAMG